jgi:ribose transport system permease protein
MSAIAATVRRPRQLGLAWVAQSGLAAWIIVALLVVGLTIADPAGFWTARNIANVLIACVVLGLVAVGQNLVVLTGGIDLSVGSLASLSALLTALLIDGYPIRTLPVILLMLVMGAAIGAGHGVLTARTGLPAFVVTLATFYLLQGVAFMISTTPKGQVTTVLSNYALDRVGPLPVALTALAVAVLVVGGLLRWTPFGRHVYAAGGDPTAARANGVPVTRTLIAAYVICSALAAAAGIVLAARATVGSPTAGQGLELSAITVVVIGGTSLLGGRGTLVGTLGGVVLLALIESSFTLLQLDATLTDLIRGVVILAAAAIFVRRMRR